MRYILGLLLCLQSICAFAQSGNYFLSHYSPSEDRLDNVCFQMVQHERGLMYFATRSGVLQFDGRSWNVIKGNGAIYTLLITPSGNLYWGGTAGFGIIKNNKQSLPELVSISEGDEARNIFQSIHVSNNLYFVNEEKIFVFNTSTDQTLAIPATELTGSFTGIFELFGAVYVNTSKTGVYKVDGDKLLRPSLELAEHEQVVFSAHSSDHYLIGLSNNKLYAVSPDLSLRQVQLEDQDYVNKSVIVNGDWVSNDLFVIGTLRGGMIFINASTGKTQEIINYATGLPDNEIFTLMNDKNQAIWAAHEYGFTRIAPHLPFRSFSHYPGLQGNLLCAISFQDNVYVGTSLGLFRLEKEDLFEEISYYVQVPVTEEKRPPKTAPQAGAEPAAVTIPPEPVTESKRKGFFRFLRRKKNDENEKVETKQATPPAAEPVKETAPLPVTQQFKTVKRTEKILRTSQYVYKKVEGIEAKVTQLLEVNGKLIAAGLGGTYEITELASTTLSETPARYIYATTDNLLFISTYSDEVKTLMFDEKKWQTLTLLENLNDRITHIFEGDENALWLCALDKVYRLSVTQEKVNDIQVIEIANPNYDEFVGIQWRDETIICNTQGFYAYRPDHNAFEKVDSLSGNTLSNYFARNTTIWYRDIHGWKLFGTPVGKRNLGLVNLFQNLRQITPDATTGNVWMITGNNELYRFYGDRITQYETGFPVLLKSFTNGEMRTGERFKFDIDQENSSLVFEIVQPDYLASPAIEYRYRLKGLEEAYSNWSNNNNVIDFPYLPSGDYSLEVQARDILGRVQNMSRITIEVLPPYWKRPWFYALEVLLFTFFVLLSFRLSARYRIVSRLLMVLTIIMLIQFIETIVGETFETRASPVIDFFIQVVIAMLVLPVEGYLREMMFRSLETNGRLKRLFYQRTDSSVNEESEEQ